MGDEEGDVELARHDGNGIRIKQQVAPPCLLLLLLRLRRRPRVYRFPKMPSRDSRDSREQKRAVEAMLGDGDREGEEDGMEKLGKIERVYGDGGGMEPERSIMKKLLLKEMLAASVRLLWSIFRTEIVLTEIEGWEGWVTRERVETQDKLLALTTQFLFGIILVSVNVVCLTEVLG